MSGGGSTVTAMDKKREVIESEFIDVLQIDQDADEALARAAGSISDAEARFARLARPALSKPPPA